MKKIVFIYFLSVLIHSTTISAMDTENQVTNKKESLLKQIQRTASQPDSVSATKKLFKQIPKLETEKAKNTILESRKWLHAQLTDATPHTKNSKWHAQASLGELIAVLACFGASALGGIFGSKELLSLGAAIGFILGIMEIIQISLSLKYVNKAESITVNNNEIREMLVALDKVRLHPTKPAKKK